MPAPLMIIAEEAESLARHLAAVLPGERYLTVLNGSDLEPALAQGPEALLAIRTEAIDHAVYRAALEAPSLRFLQVGGSGYEWLGGWDHERLRVCNAAGVLAPYLAETVIGAMIALNNHLVHYHALQLQRQWAPQPFRPLAGQRLLIVGAGAVGSATAMRAQALGMHVTGLSRQGAMLDGFDEMTEIAAIDDVLPQADVVSNHLRLTPQTRGIFDAARFAKMKPGALFLNSARGGHVDETALLAALESGRLSGAWLDVFETEPLPADSPLWSAPNLLVTPHASDMVDGWYLRFADLFAENLGRYWRGEAMINPILPN
ncbi:MAG: D-2-hydroxyacid dehydrogenase [Pseudomonadota bacterium]